MHAFILAALLCIVVGDPSVYQISVSTGTDSPGCGAASGPCASIGHVLNKEAIDDDMIVMELAGGTYSGEDNCGQTVTKGLVWLQGNGDTVTLDCHRLAVGISVWGASGAAYPPPKHLASNITN